MFIKITRIICHRSALKLNIRMSSSSSTTVSPGKVSRNEQMYEIDTQPHTTVTEGKAEIQFPAAQDVFYNPVQEFNRDLSVAVLRLYAAIYCKNYVKNTSELKPKKSKNIPSIGKVISEQKYDLVFNHDDKENTSNETNGTSTKDALTDSKNNSISLLPPGVKCEDGITILEALAASGLRSIRYAQEIGGIKQIIANDFSDRAVDCMKHNIKHNHVDNFVSTSHSDAGMLMYQNKECKQFHAVDLDPYGSPHQFLDGAVQCVADGGILLVTCTDMAVLCGNSPETCYIKYGALSLKSKSCHEIALRIVLQSIESHANRYSRYIVPLLSVSADFYVRLVVQVFTSQKQCKESFSKLAHVYQCVGCDTMTLQRLGAVVVNGKSVKYQLASGPQVPSKCPHCDHRHVCAGPIWADPIHDHKFVSLLKNSLNEKDFKTYRRLYGTLTMIEEELQDVPLYYIMDKLASTISVSLFKMVEFRSALLNAGYRVSMSHASKCSAKTDAPPEFIWDVMRAWEKLNPANRDKMLPNGADRAILEKKQKHEVSFDIHPDADPESRRKVLRFQQNPEKNWGPKQKAKTSLLYNDQQEKRERKQGKKKRKINETKVDCKKLKDDK